MTIITKTLRSLLSPGLMLLAVACFAVTLVALIGFMGGTVAFFGMTTLFSSAEVDHAVDLIGSFLAVAIAWFLFPVLTPVIATLFSDRIADMVEQADYPGQQRAKAQPLVAMLTQAIKFTLSILLLNLLCLPLYFIPGINLVVYYGLNSYLLGREFFEMVSGRYMDAKASRALRRQNRAAVMGAGLAIVFVTTLPVANLFAPIIAVVLMVHLFFSLHGLQNQAISLPPDTKNARQAIRPHGHQKIK